MSLHSFFGAAVCRALGFGANAMTLREMLARVLPDEMTLRAYCVRVCLVASAPPALLALATACVCILADIDPSAWIGKRAYRADFETAFWVIAFAPISETFLVGAVASLVNLGVKKPHHSALITGFLAAMAHAHNSVLNAIVVVWPFFVFSYSFLMWKRRSFWTAYTAAAVPHAFNNTLVLCVLWIVRSLGS